MTPLLGTKTPSAPVGDRSGGDGRAARSLLSCALWRGMGRLWRGMGGGRPPHRQHSFPDTAFFRNTAFVLFTNHSFPTHDFPPFPTISRHFPAPHPPPPIKCPRVHAPSAFLGQPRGLPRRAARSLLSCALWGGYGAAMARHGRRPSPAPATRPFLFAGRQIFLLERTSLHFSPRGEAKWVRGLSGRGVLEQYVEHGKQAQRSHDGRIACFDRRVVRNAV